MPFSKEEKLAYYHANKDKLKAAQLTWRENNPEEHKARMRKWHLKKKYKMTPDQYDALLMSQGSVCAICGNECKEHEILSVDHCHESKVVRGLLCAKCNKGLGLFCDDPDLLKRASDYLEWAATC